MATIVNQVVENMVSSLLMNCNTTDFANLAEVINTEFEKQVQEKFSSQVQQLLMQIEILQSKYDNLQMINPADPTKTNLLPLIDSTWFSLPLKGNIPQI